MIMKQLAILITISLQILLSACEKPIFIPIQGQISGTVTDNNGNILVGVEVQVTYDAPDNSGAGFPPPSGGGRCPGPGARSRSRCGRVCVRAGA